MRTPKPFEDRTHYLKAEALEALDRPAEAAATLAATHTARMPDARLQIRITGPAREALETARALRDATGARSVGINKNAADKHNRAGALTGDTLRIYLNY